jgi:hypothetical protein
MKWLWGIGIALLFSTSLFADGVDPLWEKYIKAKVTFQNDLADLLVQSHPEFKDLILTARDLQVTMAKMRQRKYYYLLKNYPEKISRDQGTIQWSNFQWTEDDNKKLLNADPEYVDLTKTKGVLEEKNQSRTDWPAARKAFVKVRKSQEYKKMLKTLMDTISEIDGELKTIR